LAADFKVIRGFARFASGTSTVTLTEGTDYDLESGVDSSTAFCYLTNSRLTGRGKSSGGGNQNLDDFSVWISNPGNIATSLQFRRIGTSGETNCSWEILQYIGPSGGENEIEVTDQGAQTIAATNLTASTAHNASDHTQAVPFILAQASAHTARTRWGGSLCVTRWLGSPGYDVEFERKISTDAAYVSYAVVEFVGSAWKIGEVEYTSGGGTPWTPATSSNNGTTLLPSTLNGLAKAFIHAQYATDNNSTGLDDAGDEFKINSTTRLRTHFRSSAGTRLRKAWVIEHDSARADGHMWVQHYENYSSDTSGPEEKVYAQTITAVLDMAQTSLMGTTCSSDGSGTAYPRGSGDVKLTTTTNVNWVVSDSGQEEWIGFDVVHWPCEPRAIDSAIDGDATTTGDICGIGSMAAAISGQATVAAAGCGMIQGDAAIAGSATTAAVGSTTGGMVAAISGSATTAGAICGRAEVAAASAGVATVAATPVQVSPIDSAIAGSASVVAVICGRGSMAGAPAGAASVAGAICGLADLGTASSAGSATTAGTARAVGVLAATIAGSASVTGSLMGGGSLAATASGSASASGTLCGLGSMGALASGAAAPTGAICGLAPLAASSAGVASITANLVAGAGGTGPIDGTIAGAATVVGNLCGIGCIDGAPAGAASLAAVVCGRGTLAGGPSGAASVAGAAQGDGALAATVSGSATVTGSLTGHIEIAAAIAGSATTAGVLCGIGCAVASSAGTSSVSAALEGDGALAAAIAGTTTVSGTLCGLANIAAFSLDGIATTIGDLQSRESIAASIAGAASVSGVICGRGCAAAVAPGETTLVGTMQALGDLVAEIDGQGSVAALLCGRLPAAAAIAGSATTDGVICGRGMVDAAIAGAATFSPAALCGRGDMSAQVNGLTIVTTFTVAGCYAAAAIIARRAWFVQCELGQSIPTVYDNEPYEEAFLPGTTLWARHRVEFLSARHVDYGDGNLFEKQARVVASLHAPLGTGDEAILAEVDAAVAAFRFQSLSADFRFGIPVPRAGRVEGQWWVVDLVCPFQFETREAVKV